MVYGTTPMPRLTLISAALVLLIGGFVWLVREHRPARLAIAIGVIDHRSWGQGPSSAVRVGITNTGRAIIRYNQMNFGGDASVRIESRNGWATRDIGPGALFPWMPALLKPGSNTSAVIPLPEGTLRWQICYKIRAASVRERVVSRI